MKTRAEYRRNKDKAMKSTNINLLRAEPLDTVIALIYLDQALSTSVLSNLILIV